MKSNPVKGLRRYVRIPFAAQVQLTVGDQTLGVHLADISLKGALLETPAAATLPLHAECSLKLPMAADGDGIVMAGRIVHLLGTQIGFECHDIDLTSLTRLRRLIELNSGDPALANREIRQLLLG